LSNKVKKGDSVLLFFSKKKKWLVKIYDETNKKFHTHLGYVDFSDIIGKEYGSKVTTSVGEDIWILKPYIMDIILKGERRTQIVYPKDIGMIIAMTGISSGYRVVESGTGSGALTTFLANQVKPDGHVFSYEVRPEFMEIALKNLQRAGLEKFVTIKLKDAKKGFDEKQVDAAIIDVGDPWDLIEPVKNALKGGGSMVSVSPTMNQVEKVVVKLTESGFVNIESMEVIMRGLEARPNMTRPSMRMIGHTAYLTFSRKVISDNV
jgi:tRNA (adenine57-N1/adenine58-N1)-methyltransferase